MFLPIILLHFLLLSIVCQSNTASDTFQFTIIHTSDIHGHVLKGKNCSDPDSCANVGDLKNFIEHMRAKQTERHKVLVFDCGDFNAGTALSDVTVIPGSFMFEIARNLSYDAQVPGNHELYLQKTIDFMVYESRSWFSGKYLLQNVEYLQDPQKRIGDNYTVLNITGFGSILVIGLMVNHLDYDRSVRVNGYAESHPKDSTPLWLQEAIQAHKETLRMVVLLTHIPADVKEADNIVAVTQADIAREMGHSLPLLFLGGHAHELVFLNTSSTEIRMENLAYFQSINTLSFSIPSDRNAPGGTEFANVTFANIGTTKAAFQEYTGVGAENWDTQDGQTMKKALAAKTEELRIDEPWAYVTRQIGNKDKRNPPSPPTGAKVTSLSSTTENPAPNHNNSNNADNDPTTTSSTTSESMSSFLLNSVYPTMHPLHRAYSSSGLRVDEPVDVYVVSTSLSLSLPPGPLYVSQLIAVFPERLAAIRGLSAEEVMKMVNGTVLHQKRSAPPKPKEPEKEKTIAAMKMMTFMNVDDDERVAMNEEYVFVVGAKRHQNDTIPPVYEEKNFTDIYSFNQVDLHPHREYDVIVSLKDASLIVQSLNKQNPNRKPFTYETTDIDPNAVLMSYLMNAMPYPPINNTEPSSQSSSSTSWKVYLTVSILAFAFLIILILLLYGLYRFYLSEKARTIPQHQPQKTFELETDLQRPLTTDQSYSPPALSTPISV